MFYSVNKHMARDWPEAFMSIHGMSRALHEVNRFV